MYPPLNVHWLDFLKMGRCLDVAQFNTKISRFLEVLPRSKFSMDMIAKCSLYYLYRMKDVHSYTLTINNMSKMHLHSEKKTAGIQVVKILKQRPKSYIVLPKF